MNGKMAEAYHSGTRNIRKIHTQSFKGKYTPRFEVGSLSDFEQNLMNYLDNEQS